MKAKGCDFVNSFLFSIVNIISGNKSRQIELLFQLWKGYADIDSSRSQNPHRVLTELSIKQVGVVIEHWMMIPALWAIPGRSLIPSENSEPVTRYAQPIATNSNHTDQLSG